MPEISINTIHYLLVLSDKPKNKNKFHRIRFYAAIYYNLQVLENVPESNFSNYPVFETICR